MSATQELFKMLSPLDLYNLGESSLVKSEISVYGMALDGFEAALQNLLEDALIITASPNRLEKWEKLLELPQRPSLPINDRHSRIIHSLALTPLCFTPQGIKNSLLGVGMDCIIKEDFPNKSLAITCLSFMGDYGNIYEMINAAGKMMPAHLAFTIDTGGISWDYFEGFFENWTAFDLKELTWEMFDTKKTFD